MLDTLFYIEQRNETNLIIFLEREKSVLQQFNLL